MTDLAPLIIAVLAGAVVIYLVDDGRIRVAVFSVILGWGIWRNRQANLDSSNPVQNGNGSLEPVSPDTTQVEADAQATDARIDAISHDRPADPDVRTGLDLLEEHDAQRRADRRPR